MAQIKVKYLAFLLFFGLFQFFYYSEDYFAFLKRTLLLYGRTISFFYLKKRNVSRETFSKKPLKNSIIGAIMRIFS
jgi:hypothetical protein